jgi:hypothetical protein
VSGTDPLVALSLLKPALSARQCLLVSGEQHLCQEDAPQSQSALKQPPHPLQRPARAQAPHHVLYRNQEQLKQPHPFQNQQEFKLRKSIHASPESTHNMMYLSA